MKCRQQFDFFLSDDTASAKNIVKLARFVLRVTPQAGDQITRVDQSQLTGLKRLQHVVVDTRFNHPPLPAELPLTVELFSVSVPRSLNKPAPPSMG